MARLKTQDKKRRKKLNEDFKRKKVKVGKRLPRADNYTDTSFKTRTVQVVQHLRSSGFGQVTRRNLNLDILLSQSQHYNSSVRHDAVAGLHELFCAHGELVSLHLARVLHKIAELFSDVHAKVRRANIRLLQCVLPKISANIITPFFPVISAHLCCAMTHIDDNIQADSLQALDVLLEFFPRLVVGNSSKLLQNFIEQIAQQGHSAKAVQPARFLFLNPNRKLSSRKWRIKVLHRLHRVLKAIVQAEESKMQTEGMSGNTAPIIKWSEDGQTSHQPFPKTIFQMSKRLTSSYSEAPNQTKGQLKKFIKTLVPLLLDCWVESCPTDEPDISSTLVPQESFPMMSIVVGIIKLLWHYAVLNFAAAERISNKWLTHLYFDTFREHFMTCFPYSSWDEIPMLLTPKKKMGKKKRENIQISDQTVNLDICDIMTFFLEEGDGDGGMELAELTWLEKIANFLRNMLLTIKLTHEEMKTVVTIVKRLISLKDYDELFEDLLTELFHTYVSKHPLSSDKKLLLNFFLTLTKDDTKNSRVDVCNKFLSTLPELLVVVLREGHQMSRIILYVIKQAACRNKAVLLENLQKYLDEIFVHLPSQDQELQHSILELLYSIPSFGETQLQHLIMVSRNPEVPVENVVFFLELLHHRQMKFEYTDDVAEVSAYFRLLFSIGFGYSMSDLSGAVGSSYSARMKESQDRFVILFDEVDSMSRHCTIVEVVCGLLNQWPNISQVQILLTRLFSDLSDTQHFLPVKAAFGAISMANTLQVAQGTSQSLIQLCSAVMNQLTNLDEEEAAILKETKLIQKLWQQVTTFLTIPPDCIPAFYSKTHNQSVPFRNVY